MNEKPIGIFDSGVGGLTVAREIMSLLPGEEVIYLGDTANLPYGDKSAEIVRQYSVDNTEFLLDHDVKVLVVACNTASSVALEYLQSRYTLPVIGVIEPAAIGAVAATRNGRVGVIGTNRTIKSGVYSDTIRKLDARVAVRQKPCPLLVPLIEENFLGHAATRLVVEEYLGGFRNTQEDTLILGCTHYPLIRDEITAVLPGVTLVDSASAVARSLEKILDERHLRAPGQTAAGYSFYATDTSDKLNDLATRILGRPVEFREVRLNKTQTV